MWLRKQTRINRPEQANCCALMEWVALSKHFHPELELLYHIPNGGKRNYTEAQILNGMGVRPGVPDYHLPIRRHGCIGLWIEMKSDKGRLTDKQQWWREHLTEAGHLVVICRSWQEVAETLTRYLEDGR